MCSPVQAEQDPLWPEEAGPGAWAPGGQADLSRRALDSVTRSPGRELLTLTGQFFGPNPPRADSEPMRVPTLSSLCLKSGLSWFRQGFSSLPCW